MHMSIARNIAAAKLKRFGTWWLSDDLQSAMAAELQKSLRIACRDTGQ